jgi:hypothetical protein
MSMSNIRETADAIYVHRTWRDRGTTRVYPHRWATRGDILAADQRVADRLPPDDSEYAPDGIFRSLDAAWRLFKRHQVRITRADVRAKLSELGYSDVAVRFSRNAGCSCGCSPGFITDQIMIDPVTNTPLLQLSLHAAPNTQRIAS